MIRSLVLPIALLAVAASCAPLLAQDTPGDAAEAAQAVAARADGAFERVDPDSEMAPVIEAAAADQPALTPALSYADLPPIAEFVPGPEVVEALEHGLRVEPTTTTTTTTATTAPTDGTP